MAMLIRNYKGYQVKLHTKRDNTTFKFGVYKSGDLHWEADSELECYLWIDGEVADREQSR